MSNKQSLLEMLDQAENQRSARRDFIRMCGGAAAMAGGLSVLAACSDDQSDDFEPIAQPTPTPSTGVTDVDILNFALSLEYLEGNYYSYAVSGAGIAAGLQAGTGTQGAVATGSGAGAARQVSFTDPVTQQFAREIAADEIAHITFLRSALGAAAAAQPAINLSGSATVTIGGAATVGAFTAAARAAQVVGPNDIFDPFLNDENFLIGSYLLTDVGVTAYRGSARLITDKTFLEAAAGILAVEAYHDGVIRSSLYARGLAAPAIFTNVQRISDARDGLDGATDTDQGIGTAAEANLVPTNGDSLALGRTAAQVLNVVYNNRAAVTSGGFFPAGVNGTIRTSGAN
ncbi:ferritin-like domain-containing protein [uncultured Sphingomonas sp.]|uniref:ferritin-like domain-containing protein n=1 Tax=uncultured Sphingomonas sp. TaxID=158754 RepID=UPI0035C97859